MTTHLTYLELQYKVHLLTGLNVKGRSRPWLEAKLAEVNAQDQALKIISDRASDAAEERDS